MKNCKNVQHYIWGSGAIKHLNSLLAGKRSGSDSSAVFLIDDYFQSHSIENTLSRASADRIVYVKVDKEPYAEKIDEITREIREYGPPPIAIVGIGGGSVMDYAKAVSILLTNEGLAEDYQGWNLVRNPGIYKIGVPTLSGTGAETSRTAVLTSSKKKLGINSEYSMFDQLILDPNLLKTVPKDQFFYTGMDCYIHCVEALRGNFIDEMSRTYAQKALQMCIDVFLHDAPVDDIMVASYFGGCAMANSNVGICHPLSYGLSLVLHLHHGIANCIAFDHLEEYYPQEVNIYRKMRRKHNPRIPKIIDGTVTEEDIDHMIAATLVNEKPLSNAFGKEWRSVFTTGKIRSLLKRM